MSEYITVARPYAKAAFDFAYEHQCVDHWQEMLFIIDKVSQFDKIVDMMSGSLAPETLSDHFIAICGELLDEHGRNLIRIMAENGRLKVITEVLQQFIQLKALKEGTIDVNVTSARELTQQQLAKIAQAMEQRLSRNIKLNCTIDNSIIAGVIIQSGDMVIDGSVRGRLERLTDILQS